MSDFGMFEADEAAQAQPRLAAKTAGRKLEAAIDAVRRDYGRFLIGATGIDEFEDRWHLSKADIRRTVEPYVHPATGTMRRIMNAMKADWKLAHPYKVALSHEEAGFGSMPEGDGPPKNQDLDETYHPSHGNLIPEGDFEGWKDSVDQGGPEKVDAHAFTPGGDSGSDRHAAKRKSGPCDSYTAHPNGEDKCPDCGWPISDHDDWDEKGKKEAAMLVADIYTDFARANGLRVASLDTLDAYAATGIAEADYRLLESMIVRTAEECEDDDDDSEDEDSDDGEESDDSDDSEGGEAPDFGGSEDDADNDGDGDHDDDDHHGEGEEEEFDFGDEDSDGVHDDGDHHDDGEDHDFGGDGGGDVGQTFTVPEQAPPLDPQLQQEIPAGDTDGSAPVPPEVIDSLLGLPEGTIEQLLLEEVEEVEQGAQGGGDDFLGGAGGDNTQPPRMARRRVAAPDESEEALMARQRQQQRDAIKTKFPTGKPDIRDLYRRAKGGDLESYAKLRSLWNERGWTASRAARTFWAAEGDEQQSEGGGEQQAPQDPAAAQGVDPAAMGMMPPPGSQAVQPPAPPQPIEDQPAEDALLDTANQAIMQMIDRETQEYQQIIDPLSQALQAIQFAQQVEQAEHPMDVTPPEGTVNVDPSQAPGGAGNPMQQQAMRRRASGDNYINRADLEEYLGRTLPHEDLERYDIPSLADRYLERHPHVIGDQPSRYDRDEFDGPRYPGPNWKDQWLDANGPSEDEYSQMLQDHDAARDARRQAKKARVLKNAARLIAGRYGLSHGGERMLVQAMSRRNYEHVREALQLLPPGHLEAPQYRAAVRHIGEMFAAENPRFNRDAWMRSVLGSAPGSRLPFDRARRTAGETLVHTPTLDAFEWENDQPRVDDNIAVNDLPKMVGASRADDAISRLQRWTKWREQNGLVVPGGDGGIHLWMQKTRNPAKPKVGPRASNELHAEQGLQPDAPRPARPKVQKAVNPTLKKTKYPKAAPKKAGKGVFLDDLGGDDDLSQYHTKEIIERYRNAEPDTDYHDSLFEELHHRAEKNDRDAAAEVLNDVDMFDYGNEGDDPAEIMRDMVQNGPREPIGYNKDWTYETGRTEMFEPIHPKRRKVPTDDYALPDDADPRVNRNLLSNRRDATWGEWEPAKQASFFTRRVPGWRWDDHLNGYISKEGRAFTCACGEKVAAPSYKTCGCGKVWNVYAIGDTHHLASDSAEMFIAREIPVRDGVIMANRKMAGILDDYNGDWGEYFNSWAKWGNDDVCGDPFNEGCREPLNDGEGYDGYCGNCADRLDEEGHWDGRDEDEPDQLDPKDYVGWDPDEDPGPDDPRIKGAARLFAKLASDGMSYEDAMRHIDDVLAEGEGHELHRYPGLPKPVKPEPVHGDGDCPDCGGDGVDWDSYPNDEDEADLCGTCGGTGEGRSAVCPGCQEWHPMDDMEAIDTDRGIEDVCPGCAEMNKGPVCPTCGERALDGHHPEYPCARQRRADAAWSRHHLADWTKYDDEVDPVVEAYGKSKIPSTKAPRIPRDWSRREPDGKWKNTNFAPKRK